MRKMLCEYPLLSGAVNTVVFFPTKDLVFLAVPPYFTVGPTSQKVRVGDDVTLDCIATGDPVPTQKWNKDGGLMLLGNRLCFI